MSWLGMKSNEEQSSADSNFWDPEKGSLSVSNPSSVKIPKIELTLFLWANFVEVFFRYYYYINARYHIISDYSFIGMFNKEGKKHCMRQLKIYIYTMQPDSSDISLWLEILSKSCKFLEPYLSHL